MKQTPLSKPHVNQIDLSTEETKTMRTEPFHSIKQNVHHNNTSCTEGNNIERENRRPGTGGKPLCQHCRNLS